MASFDHHEIARLRWRCRRGMRELDQAMCAYLNDHYREATDGERERFEELLQWQDPELYRLICGKQRNAAYQSIVDKIATSLGGATGSISAR